MKPDSKTIAQAYAPCLTRAPFAAAAANYMTLATRLQVALMQAHERRHQHGHRLAQNAALAEFIAEILSVTLFPISGQFRTGLS